MKVVCIGNLTVGGTGKTPLCICIFKHLKNLGYNPIFLTSGYKGKIVGPAKVKENNDDFYYGDEPLLLSKVGPTIVSKNKYKGIVDALRKIPIRQLYQGSQMSLLGFGGFSGLQYTSFYYINVSDVFTNLPSAKSSCNETYRVSKCELAIAFCF